MMFMKFGKYKGRPFSEIPDDYFEWLLDQTWLDALLRQQIVDYLDWQADSSSYGYSNWQNYNSHGDYHGRRSAPKPLALALAPEERADLGKMLKIGYHGLSHEYHSDKGGSDELMRRLNALVEKLRAEGLMS